MAINNQPACDSYQSDHEPFHQMNSDSDVMRFLPKLLSREESDATIARIEEHFDESGFGWWALEKKETGELIGFTGLYIPKFEAHFTPCVEVGWGMCKLNDPFGNLLGLRGP